MEERQTKYTIAETFELPSGGKIYNTKINPVVELRSMTARDEMKRTSPTSTLPFKTLADIIEGCMLEKPAVHVYDMALGDYEFLLHKLRIVSYGGQYRVITNCPDCGEQVETDADLDTLEVKEFDLDVFESYKTFTLPKSNHTITIRFQTPRMLDERDSLIKEMRRKYKSANIDFSILVTLKQLIESVDGQILNPNEAENFINKLPAMDMIKIQNNSALLDSCIGINTALTVPCTSCGADILTFFRFGQEFFRPTNI